MNYDMLLEVCEYVGEKTGQEMTLKHSKFIMEKELAKNQSCFLKYFNFTGNGKDLLIQRKHAKQGIKIVAERHEKEYMIRYNKNMRDLPVCDDVVTEINGVNVKTGGNK